MGRIWLIAVLLIAGFSGCLSDTDLQDASTDIEAAAPVGGESTERTYRPNVWLLDTPIPANTRISGGAEPSILTSKDGSTIWIGDTSGLYLSNDQGATWQEGADPFLASADGWTLAEDDAGNFYFATTTTVTLSIARSSDNGRTADHVDHIADAAPVADRPWIAARGDGEVVMFMYDFGRSNSETCVHSTDGGETWLDRGLLTASPQGGNTVFDKDGNFYVGEDAGRIWKFNGTCLQDAGAKDMFNRDLGANNMLQIQYEDDDFYMAAVGSGNRDILLAGSQGWSDYPTVMKVSPPVLKGNAFPTISVHEGQVAVAWYGSETPGDPSDAAYNGAFNVYLAVIDGFWSESPSVRHVRITEEPNHVGDICMAGIGCTDEESDRDLLDYFMIDHDIHGGMHIAYGDDGDSSIRKVSYAYVPPMPAEAPEATPETSPDANGDAPPIVAFTVLEHDTKVKVDASATVDPEGQPMQYVWDWGDGRTDTGVKAFHEYASFGAVEINLTVVDAAGNEAWKTERLVVGDDAPYKDPLADWTYTPDSPFVGQPVYFSDLSSDPDGTIESWAWDFGDGGRSNESSPTHTYARPGSFNVRLVVADDWQNTDQYVQRITVEEAPEEPVNQSPTAEKSTPGLGLVGLMVSLCLAVALISLRRRFSS